MDYNEADSKRGGGNMYGTVLRRERLKHNLTQTEIGKKMAKVSNGSANSNAETFG